MELVVGITGASGTIYAIRLLEVLRELGVHTHVIFSEYAYVNLELETDWTREEAELLADSLYHNRDMAASVSSGSFPVDGVIILPCSMKSLAAAANGFCDNLIARVCDVALKERRKLVLCPRETPLHAVHLENMLKLTRMGAVMVPPMPAFYNKPQNIDDIIDHQVMKVLDQFGLRIHKEKRWKNEAIL